MPARKHGDREKKSEYRDVVIDKRQMHLQIHKLMALCLDMSYRDSGRLETGSRTGIIISLSLDNGNCGEKAKTLFIRTNVKTWL